MNNLMNVCAILVIASISTCATSAYTCAAPPKDFYESSCYGGQDLKCYSEDEYPSYRVAKVAANVLKVTTTYKGKAYISLWSTCIVGEDVDTAYSRMDSGVARVLAAYAEVDSSATYTALERIYCQDAQAAWAKVYTDKSHYTLFTCQGGGTMESASYVQSPDWWVADRLTCCGSTNIADEDAYRILAAATLAKVDYSWIRSEIDRSIYVTAGHKTYLYKVAAGYIDAV